MNGVVYATMVTTAAAPEMKWLHHRMPRVLVSGERAGGGRGAGSVDGSSHAVDEVCRWLAGDEVTLREMAVGPTGHRLGGLVSEKADKAVGNVANSGPHLIGR